MVEEWVNSLRDSGYTWAEIGQQLYGDDLSKSAAYGRIKRLRDNSYNENTISFRRADTAFEESSFTTAPVPYWGGKQGAVREDRMTFEELKYLAQTGRSDTKRRADKKIKEILEREGVTDISQISDDYIFDRPSVIKVVAGKRITYLFGRGRSDLQNARVRQQLKNKGINWSDNYSDFAGYGGK